MTIVLLVGLCLHGSTTVNASDTVNLESVYPYWIWDASTNQLAISKTVYKHSYTYGSNGVSIKDQNMGTNVITTAGYYCWVGNASADNDILILQYFPELNTWTVLKPYITDLYEVGYGKVSTSKPSSSSSKYTLYTNGHTPASLSGYVNIFAFNTSLPPTMPEVTIGLGDIEGIINDALNATTSVTTQALTINQNINNTYNTYQSGGITQAEFNAQMEQYRNQLESLNESTGATLADQMAVNNALTNLDITINQQVNNVSPKLMTLLETIRSNISSIFNQYSLGNSTQSNAIKQIKTHINDNLLKATNQYTSIADREAINGTIEYANSLINAIGSYSDLEQDISDAAESSDKAEKDYLDSLTSETTASIQELSPKDSFSDAEIGTAQEVLSIIWNNKLVKRLLVICGCFMVVCVVLGIRYKV